MSMFLLRCDAGMQEELAVFMNALSLLALLGPAGEIFVASVAAAQHRCSGWPHAHVPEQAQGARLGRDLADYRGPAGLLCCSSVAHNRGLPRQLPWRACAGMAACHRGGLSCRGSAHRYGDDDRALCPLCCHLGAATLYSLLISYSPRHSCSFCKI